MFNKATLLAAVAVLTAGSLASASEIYKWIDEDGNVHYGDKPVVQAERVAIVSRPTDNARVQAQAQERADARARAAEEAMAAAAAEPSPEQLMAEAREREQKCSTYKDRLQKFVTSRRLYREDENGERVYLDEAETQAARERVENRVAEYCNS